MPVEKSTTLTQYLIEERRRFPHASGDFNGLILSVALACKSIARTVAFGALSGHRRGADCAGAPQGAARKTAEVRSNEVFLRQNEWGGYLGGMVSGKMQAPYQIPKRYPKGKYLLLFEPLDGASNIDVNASVGSVFSIIRAPYPGKPAMEEDFLRPGSEQVAAGYAVYGPATMLVITVGNGVSAFTLDPNLGEFILTHAHIRIPAETQEFAINASNSRFWEAPVKRYVDECLAGSTGPRGRDFNMRWIASMVAEAHRILMHGGVFLYPHDSRAADENGHLHLLCEANPIGFLIEQAGGRASTGRQFVLEVKPSTLHQRVGLVFGSRNEVDRIERYHREPAPFELTYPLFNERSLFRPEGDRVA